MKGPVAILITIILSFFFGFVFKTFAAHFHKYNSIMAKYNSHTGKWENVLDSRWGEHVFHRENFTAREPSLGWDGKFHDQEMPPGTFVYMINLPVADGMEKIVSGDLMLLC